MTKVHHPQYFPLVMSIMVLFFLGCQKEEEDDQKNGASQGFITDYIIDARDGNRYSTVKMGSQWWMAENLRYLPSVTLSGTGSFQVPFYYVNGYEGTDAAAAKSYKDGQQVKVYDTYGVLYNWSAAMGGDTSGSDPVRGVCPEGWHLPGDQQWQQLEIHLGLSAGEASSTGWRARNEGSMLAADTALWEHHMLMEGPETGSSGFQGLPGGYRQRYPTMGGNAKGIKGLWWTSTTDTTQYAWYRMLNFNSSKIYRSSIGKERGLSVRCVKN